jgi:hypothetical protein
MKKVFKVLGLGALLTAFSAAPVFAQDECEGIYGQFTANYRSTEMPKVKVAIDAGKELIAKCSAKEEFKEPVAFVNKQLPNMEKRYNFATTITRLETSIKNPQNVNADETFAAGKEFLTLDPNHANAMDVMIVMATVGFDKAAANPPVDKYNADAINYARQAIQKIESGTPSTNYGLYNYSYKTKEYQDGKNNALGWLNYYIGYIMYNRQNQKKEALPYFYKATQFNSGVKKNPFVYQAIGDFYKDEYNRIDDERIKVAEQAKTEANEETKKQLIEKAKEMLALQKGYADRMIDAYARAWANAGTDKAYKDGLYNTLRVLYGFRNDSKMDGFNESYLAAFNSRPLPDPMSAVKPVVESTTATTVSSSTTPSTVTPPVNSTTAAKPAATTNGTAKGATTKPGANGAANGATVKKPAATPKKKGTR